MNQKILKLRSLEQRRREMKRLRRDKVTLEEIGKRYGVTRQRVWEILKG
jgi:DNA-directed RNA polymerase sigma subunit (sigma70/sigma32)